MRPAGLGVRLHQPVSVLFIHRQRLLAAGAPRHRLAAGAGLYRLGLCAVLRGPARLAAALAARPLRHPGRRPLCPAVGRPPSPARAARGAGPVRADLRHLP